MFFNFYRGEDWIFSCESFLILKLIMIQNIIKLYQDYHDKYWLK